VELPLRPIGAGGTMALSLSDFAQHFASGAAPLWQWQALCKARPILGSDVACQSAARVIRQLLLGRPWQETDRAEIYASRLNLERGAAPLNLKRGPGGTLDVEFLVQMLQLQHAAAFPAVLDPNTQEALAALTAAGCLPRADAQALAESYRFLRQVESGLRLLSTSARHDLPGDPLDLQKLALLLGTFDANQLRGCVLDHLSDNRRRFERLVGAD
jgi:glutamate-ammonia-ligase adenylyltransferase